MRGWDGLLVVRRVEDVRVGGHRGHWGSGGRGERGMGYVVLHVQSWNSRSLWPPHWLGAWLVYGVPAVRSRKIA